MFVKDKPWGVSEVFNVGIVRERHPTPPKPILPMKPKPSGKNLK